MHENQLDVDEELARRLIAAQFPELAALPVRPVQTAGTVNTIMRIGEDLVARFPLQETSSAELTAETTGLAEFTAVCPFPAPRPFGVGEATALFPSTWSVQTWVPGDVAAPDRHASSIALAEDVASLVVSLRSVDRRGRIFDGRGRGGSLSDHDEWMTHCFAQSTHLIDVPRAERLWAALRALPPSDPDVMSHRDLTPANLLVAEVEGVDRLVGVLDGGAFGPADPALDLVAGWHLFDAAARRTVREGVCAGEIEWLRGAAWALQQAMGLIWYYEETNPEMSALGLSTVRRLLDDVEIGTLVR